VAVPTASSDPAPITPSPSAPPAETTPESIAAEPPKTPEPPPAAAPEPEPAPVPTARIVEIAPITPSTTQPFARETSVVNTPATAEPEAGAPAAAPRKRARKAEAPAAEANEEPTLGLDLDGGAAPEGNVVERVITSDGATRLIVTAYIGIGNRLFIRGAGPGLTWEKGVPLQFISIGKWRWETNDAAAPVQFKLYKNDEVECAALGAQTLDPGHQQEVTAAF
jgi:hypothetical protein